MLLEKHQKRYGAREGKDLFATGTQSLTKTFPFPISTTFVQSQQTTGPRKLVAPKSPCPLLGHVFTILRLPYNIVTDTRNGGFRPGPANNLKLVKHVLALLLAIFDPSQQLQKSRNLNLTRKLRQAQVIVGCSLPLPCRASFPFLTTCILHTSFHVRICPPYVFIIHC